MTPHEVEKMHEQEYEAEFRKAYDKGRVTQVQKVPNVESTVTFSIKEF